MGILVYPTMLRSFLVYSLVRSDVERHDQDYRAEAEEERRQRTATLVYRLRADLHSIVDEECLEPRVDERRQRRGERRHASSWRTNRGIARCRIGDRDREVSR